MHFPNRKVDIPRRHVDEAEVDNEAEVTVDEIDDEVLCNSQRRHIRLLLMSST